MDMIQVRYLRFDEYLNEKWFLKSQLNQGFSVIFASSLLS